MPLHVPAVPNPIVYPGGAKPNTRYKVFELDLSVARTDAPLGIRDLGRAVNALLCLRTDFPITVKLDDPANDPIEVDAGACIENFLIHEVYVTNAAGAAGQKARFVVEWAE